MAWCSQPRPQPVVGSGVRAICAFRLRGGGSGLRTPQMILLSHRLALTARPLVIGAKLAAWRALGALIPSRVQHDAIGENDALDRGFWRVSHGDLSRRCGTDRRS